MKEQTRKGLQEPQLLLCSFHDFTNYNESAHTGIVVDVEEILQLCYIQTSHMINLFEKFPEIVFIDGTYNVNSHGMPLYCIMVEDGHGHGRVVFYAATTEEDTYSTPEKDDAVF